MSRNKILNDPVYGFVNIPYGILFDLVEHPYFQRLRRIKQVSLTHYVYPGALHTRFHHALGALHLMRQTIEVLRGKGTEITEEEATAVSIAILLHDIGHGPFSHTLEHTLINVHHEELSILFMERLNALFQGQLTMAIQVFKDEHPKKFLHQLVSGQLDMDRMDYLNRDSFFTGVHEGVIGYDRIIKMLAVHDGQLVVEEKGIYSIEKFLIARRLMYWQVYLHKTVLSAELMLVQALKRAKLLSQKGVILEMPGNLRFFLDQNLTKDDFITQPETLLEHFAALDDHDIVSALKAWQNAPDPILAYLAQSLVHRRLFKLEFHNEPMPNSYVENIRKKLMDHQPFNHEWLPYLLISGMETNSAYSAYKDEIKILFKDGRVLPMSMVVDHGIQPRIFTKYYLCYPKVVRDMS